MESLERASVLLALAEALRANGSWTGETHIQKATYFLQELLRVPLELEFILYKHGPYSFDLRSELTAMQANDILALKPQPRPYGPSYLPGPASRLLQASFGGVAARFSQQIRFIAEKLGGKRVSDLEKVATSLYVTLEGATPEQRAMRIHGLKPHISVGEAEQAIVELDRIRAEAGQQALILQPAR